MSPLADVIIACAKSYLGVRETSRNRGVFIDEWIRRIGLDPEGAHPWCAAFAFCMIDDGCTMHGSPNPLVRSGKVSRLWSKNGRAQRSVPVVGAIACHAVDPGDHLSPGHCGIVEAFDAATVTLIEGNTSADGSREGREVCRHVRAIGWCNLGFLDPAT
jgi:hypothetical protein